ncbi:MAG TPA: ABC transporter ATP-binding protein [Pirellulales bacterium]|jgi:ABC-2 type transport system ATP-binding protein|nr:ABC transporter ATP-binding protein [Pirellulales bacterium]
MIELEHVSRTYGQKLAVADLSLTVPRGELFALLGANGAGKTTTIKMLVGLLRPTSGTVRICGHDMASDGRAACQLLGYVPDEPYLYEKLSGREFLHFIAGMYGLAMAERQERVRQAIEQFNLEGFVDDLCETYSHGMKQRTVFAAALLHDPAVLVIDEPMVGLDPRSARIVKDLLRAHATAGMTIFMSTHSLAVAEEIADRIGIFAHGRLRCLGTLSEIKHELHADEASLEQLFLDVTAEPSTATLLAEKL